MIKTKKLIYVGGLFLLLLVVYDIDNSILLFLVSSFLHIVVLPAPEGDEMIIIFFFIY